MPEDVIAYLPPFKFNSGCATKVKFSGPITKQTHMAEPTEDEFPMSHVTGLTNRRRVSKKTCNQPDQ